MSAAFGGLSCAQGRCWCHGKINGAPGSPLKPTRQGAVGETAGALGGSDGRPWTLHGHRRCRSLGAQGGEALAAVLLAEVLKAVTEPATRSSCYSQQLRPPLGLYRAGRRYAKLFRYTICIHPGSPQIANPRSAFSIPLVSVAGRGYALALASMHTVDFTAAR